MDETRPGPVELLLRPAEGAGSQGKPASPPASLAVTQWEVLEINGVPAKPGGRDKKLHIAFTSDAVSGVAGVNSFTGLNPHQARPGIRRKNRPEKADS